MQQQWLGSSAAALELLEKHIGSIPTSLIPRARARMHSRCSLLRSCSRGVREGHMLYSKDAYYIAMLASCALASAGDPCPGIEAWCSGSAGRRCAWRCCTAWPAAAAASSPTAA